MVARIWGMRRMGSGRCRVRFCGGLVAVVVARESKGRRGAGPRDSSLDAWLLSCGVGLGAEGGVLGFVRAREASHDEVFDEEERLVEEEEDRFLTRGTPRTECKLGMMMGVPRCSVKIEYLSREVRPRTPDISGKHVQRTGGPNIRRAQPRRHFMQGHGSHRGPQEVATAPRRWHFQPVPPSTRG
ncbi:hypothetical protein VTI74DRAFT_7201 [Chaetomium olivicolor]